MVIDTLDNIYKYEKLNSYFKQAFDYIRLLDFNNLQTGITRIAGDDLFINVTDTTLKNREEALLESHNQYIDIQIPISSIETYGWMAREKCKEISLPYSSEKDIEFYSDIASVYFTLSPGEFVIFFPQDAHAPCIGEGDTRKIIIKVKS